MNPIILRMAYKRNLCDSLVFKHLNGVVPSHTTVGSSASDENDFSLSVLGKHEVTAGKSTACHVANLRADKGGGLTSSEGGKHGGWEDVILHLWHLTKEAKEKDTLGRVLRGTVVGPFNLRSWLIFGFQPKSRNCEKTLSTAREKRRRPCSSWNNRRISTEGHGDDQRFPKMRSPSTSSSRHLYNLLLLKIPEKSERFQAEKSTTFPKQPWQWFQLYSLSFCKQSSRQSNKNLNSRKKKNMRVLLRRKILGRQVRWSLP